MATEAHEVSDMGVDGSLGATGDEYKGGGAKKSHHGYTFQFHLLMLFAVRAYNLGYLNFKLGTEVADAYKLDDIVFSYHKGKNEGNGRYFCLVQTKHTQREQKESLRAAQLFEDPNKDFSLRMYFNSYRKLIRGGKGLLGICDEIQDIILCTNMSFKNGDRLGDFVIEEQTFVTNRQEESGMGSIFRNELKRFRDKFQGREALILHLKNGAIKIPSKFAVCVFNKMEYSINEETENAELFEQYENVLRDEVADVKNLRFRQSFCHAEDLSTVAKHFRDELFSQFVKCCNFQGEKDEKTFCKFLQETKLHASLKMLSVRGVSLDSPKQLAKRLSRILNKTRHSGVIQVLSEESVLWKHFKSLMKFVLNERAGKITFSKEFLFQESLPGNLDEFRDSLRKCISYFELTLKDLENYVFEIDSSVWVVAFDDFLDTDVCKFLKVLSFSLNQPSIDEMEGLILEEIKSHFKESEMRNAYLRFFKMMYSWAESKNGKYLTDKDVKEFFHSIQKEFLGSIRFNLVEPVQNFTGRERQLEELHEWLHGGSCGLQVSCGRKAVISQSKAISGLGGIGKSELARKYAQMHFRSLYDNVIWIDAGGSDRMEICFHMLAFDIIGIKKENQNGDKKAFESIIWETYKFFEGKRTLFIFDNADCTSDVEPFFPRLSEKEQMYIIITSRSQSWSDIDVLRLDNFTLVEACDLIKVCLGHLPSFSDNDAIELANTLSFFPLAIKQAVSYIEEMSRKMKNLGKEFTICDYILLFEKKTKEILDYTFPRDLRNSYSRTTFKTMQIAIDYAKESEDGEVAIHLLNVMSYLSPNNIDMKVLCSCLVDHDDVELAQGLELLTRFSIASVSESKASIHRLIQLVNRVCLKDSGLERQTLMEVLNFVLLMDTEHAISAWDFASQYGDIMEKLSNMPLMILEQLSDKLMTKLALKFGERAISILKSYLGPDHPEVIFIRRGMGRALYFDGKSEQSLAIFQEVMEHLKKIFGENPDVLWTKNYMGFSLLELGRFSESLDLFMYVLKKGQLMVEEDSKLLFSARVHISRVLGLTGNSEEALKYLEDNNRHSQKIVDEYKRLSEQYAHRQNENVSNSKGGFYKYKEFLNLAIRHGKLNYAIDVDNVIQAYVNISLLNSSKGNYEESLQNAEEAHKLLSLKKLGENHCKLINIKTIIALNLCHLGKTDLSLNMLREAVKIQLEVARMDLATIHVKFKIGDILCSQLKYQEALKMYEEVDDDIKDLVKSEDPIRVRCKHRIALLMCSMGQPKASVNVLAESFAILENNSELTHSIDELIAEIENIGKFLLQKENEKEALQVYKYVYQLRKQYKGEQHIETLETKFVFSEIYCHHKRKGSLEKGLDYLEELNAVLLKKLVEKDPRVEMLMMKIYKSFILLKQIEKAKSMMIESFKVGIEILGNDSEFILCVWGMIMRLESL